MKKFKKCSVNLKHYWPLFLKSHSLLNTTTYRTIYCFKQPIREIDILNFLLDLSPELKVTYELYQDLLFALQTKNSERLNHLLKTEYHLISPELQTAFQTFKMYQSYINSTLPLKESIIKLKSSNELLLAIVAFTILSHIFSSLKI